MKVLIHAMEYPPIKGGGGTYVYNLARGLAKAGVNVHVVTSGNTDDDESHGKNLIVSRRVIFENLYYGKGNIVKGIDQLLTEIQMFKPDIIHTHHSLEKLMIDIVDNKSKIPHISTHHKTPEYRQNKPHANGKWSLYDYVNKEGVFIAPSKAFKKDLLESGVKEENVNVVYPGVDQGLFYETSQLDKRVKSLKEELQLKNDDITILIPSVVRERKGIEFTLKSISKVAVPSKKIKVIVTGLSEITSDSKKIKDLSDFLKPNQLLVTRPFSFLEMPILYALSDVVAFGSEAEGLGMVVLEAMACERVIVSTNVMGINEIITHNTNGLLAEFGDQKTFSNNLQSVLDNKDGLKFRLVENGKKTLTEKFNLKLQAAEHITVYTKEINK